MSLTPRQKKTIWMEAVAEVACGDSDSLIAFDSFDPTAKKHFVNVHGHVIAIEDGPLTVGHIASAVKHLGLSNSAHQTLLSGHSHGFLTSHHQMLSAIQKAGFEIKKAEAAQNTPEGAKPAEKGAQGQESGKSKGESGSGSKPSGVDKHGYHTLSGVPSTDKPAKKVYTPEETAAYEQKKKDKKAAKLLALPGQYWTKDLEPTGGINGLAFTPAKPNAWLEHKDVPLDTPPMPRPPAKNGWQSSGVVLVEPDGRVWMRSSKNDYGGAGYTFAKGRIDDGVSEQQNALKELQEETGLTGSIGGYLGDYPGTMTTTRYFVGARTGGRPTDFDDETEDCRLVTLKEAAQIAAGSREKEVLRDLRKHLGDLAGDSVYDGFSLFQILFAMTDAIECATTATPTLLTDALGEHWVTINGHKVKITPGQGVSAAHVKDAIKQFGIHPGAAAALNKAHKEGKIETQEHLFHAIGIAHSQLHQQKAKDLQAKLQAGTLKIGEGSMQKGLAHGSYEGLEEAALKDPSVKPLFEHFKQSIQFGAESGKDKEEAKEAEPKEAEQSISQATEKPAKEVAQKTEIPEEAEQATPEPIKPKKSTAPYGSIHNWAPDNLQWAIMKAFKEAKGIVPGTPSKTALSFEMIAKYAGLPKNELEFALDKYFVKTGMIHHDTHFDLNQITPEPGFEFSASGGVVPVKVKKTGKASSSAQPGNASGTEPSQKPAENAPEGASPAGSTPTTKPEAPKLTDADLAIGAQNAGLVIAMNGKSAVLKDAGHTTTVKPDGGMTPAGEPTYVVQTKNDDTGEVTHHDSGLPIKAASIAAHVGHTKTVTKANAPKVLPDHMKAAGWKIDADGTAWAEDKESGATTLINVDHANPGKFKVEAFDATGKSVLKHGDLTHEAALGLANAKHTEIMAEAKSTQVPAAYKGQFAPAQTPSGKTAVKASEGDTSAWVIKNPDGTYAVHVEKDGEPVYPHLSTEPDQETAFKVAKAKLAETATSGLPAGYSESSTPGVIEHQSHNAKIVPSSTGTFHASVMTKDGLKSRKSFASQHDADAWVQKQLTKYGKPDAVTAPAGYTADPNKLNTFHHNGPNGSVTISHEPNGKNGEWAVTTTKTNGEPLHQTAATHDEAFKLAAEQVKIDPASVTAAPAGGSNGSPTPAAAAGKYNLPDSMKSAGFVISPTTGHGAVLDEKTGVSTTIHGDPKNAGQFFVSTKDGDGNIITKKGDLDYDEALKLAEESHKQAIAQSTGRNATEPTNGTGVASEPEPEEEEPTANAPGSKVGFVTVGGNKLEHTGEPVTLDNYLSKIGGVKISQKAEPILKQMVADGKFADDSRLQQMIAIGKAQTEANYPTASSLTATGLEEAMKWGSIKDVKDKAAAGDTEAAKIIAHLGDTSHLGTAEAVEQNFKNGSWDDILHTAHAGTQGGSNPGGQYTTKNGQKVYAKFYKDAGQAYAENASANILKGLGLGAPDSTVVKKGKETAFVSKWMTDKKGDLGEIHKGAIPPDVAKKALDGWAANVLLGNWDAVGMNRDNMSLTHGGEIVHTDLGGTLQYRAQGAKKQAHELTAAGDWDSMGATDSKSQYKPIFAAAGYKAPEDIPNIASQIQAIENLQSLHGGWDNYLKKTAPAIPAGERKKLADLLTSRTAELVAKKHEINQKSLGKYGALIHAVSKGQTHDNKPYWPVTLTTSQAGNAYHQKAVFKAQATKATHAQKSAISAYQDGQYTEINGALYSNKLQNASDHIKDHVKALDELYSTNAAEMPDDQIVHRGFAVSNPTALAKYMSLQPGDEFPIGGYQSTSTGDTAAFGSKPLIMHVLVRKGTKVASVDAISHGMGERELLLNRKGNYKVLSTWAKGTDGKNHITLEYLGDWPGDMPSEWVSK